jgi:aryl-alcohol dehydrogenase-like predicted oxidoreductase
LPAASSPESTIAPSPPEQGTRFTVGRAGAMYQTRYWHEREFDTIEELRSVAKESDMSLTTLAVRWVISNKAITAPIIGASRPEQLADNLARRGRRKSSARSPDDLKAKLDEMTLCPG